MKRESGIWLRLIAFAAGLLLVVLAVIAPQQLGEQVDWNDDRLKTETLVPGDVLEQPVDMPQSFDQLSVRIEATRETKNLSMRVSLVKDGAVAAEEEFPLAKVKAKGKLILETGVQPQGSYVVRVEVIGEGNTKLGAGEENFMLYNGQEQTIGLAVRVNFVESVYSVPAVFAGALLVLLAFTPAGGKEAAKHG